MHWMNLLLGFSIYFMVGIGSGLLSGLIGAGGGLIIVPGLLFAFRFTNVSSEIAMHVAIGTSLATMIVIAIRSLFGQMKFKIPFFSIYKQIALGVMIGVITGSILAYFIHSFILSIVFGIFVLVMAYNILTEKTQIKTKSLPGQMGMSLAGAFIGLLAGLIGVGGSAFSVPFLTQRGVNIRSAILVSIATTLTLSVLGSVMFMITGFHVQNLPHWSAGYVYGPAWAGVSIGGLLASPWGVKLSHYVSDRKLKLFFGLFLIVVGLHMLIPV